MGKRKRSQSNSNYLFSTSAATLPVSAKPITSLLPSPPVFPPVDRKCTTTATVKRPPSTGAQRCCDLTQQQSKSTQRASTTTTTSPDNSPSSTSSHSSSYLTTTASPSARLSAANLALHNALMAPKKAVSPSKAMPDNKTKLLAYNIYAPVSLQMHTLPPELANLLQGHIFRERHAQPATGVEGEILSPSPRADKVVRLQQAAAEKQEDDGIDALARHLYLHPVLWDGDDREIDVARNHNLIKGFLPHAPDGIAAQLGRLEHPRPDLCFGYILSRIASKLSVPSPFLPKEELVVIARKAHISKDVAFPFLTVQWKSGSINVGHPAAEVQGARDAAAIVNANHILQQLSMNGSDDDDDGAALSTLSPATTCHFSSTCDLSTVNLYLHYRRDNSDDPAFPFYETVILFQGFLNDKDNMVRFRRYMRNIYDWAVGIRLTRLKSTVKRLYDITKDVQGPAYDDASTQADSESLRDSVTSPTLLREAPPLFTPPLSGTSASSAIDTGRGRKRQRRVNGSEEGGVS